MSNAEGAAMPEVRVPDVERVRMSWEDYLRLPDRPKAEWVDGEVVIVNVPMSPDHSDGSFGLRTVLKRSLPQCKVYQEVGVHLPRNRVRVPDVMVVSARPEGQMATETPILVAEVLSRGTQNIDLIEKAPEYAEAGISQYWILDPDERVLRVYELVDGHWERLIHLDGARATGQVAVGDHGTVPLDLAEILAG